MSLVSNPLIGKAKQSMGGATFTTWKGLQVLKNKATSVANPRSEGQINQRARLAILVSLYSFISSVVKQGFKEMAVGMSEFNGFTSANLKNLAVTASGGVATLNYDELLISKGSLATTPITGTLAEDGNVSADIFYSNVLTNPNYSLQDKALAAVYNRTQGIWAYSIGTSTRSSSGVIATFSAPLQAGDILDNYLAFYNPTTGKVSTSVYAESAVV